MYILFIPAFYLYSTISGSQSWFVIPCVMTVAMVIQILIERSKERRERLLILLPISVQRIGLVRLLILLTPCFSLYGLYLIIHFAMNRSLPHWHQGGLDMVMFFGLTLLGFSIYFFQRDLLSSFFRKDSHIGVDAIILLVLCAIIIYGTPLTLAILYHGEIHVAEPLIWFLLISGILLLYPTVLTFKRRRTFLE